MPDPGEILVSLDGVRKDYHGLRPLRVQTLELREAETIALLGFDQAMAEVLVNLITGASVPDAGIVRAFGQLTTAISDGDTWLRLLDQFGIISERAVLLDRFTTEQNLAVPLSLELENLPGPVRLQIAQLAADVGIDVAELGQSAATLSPMLRARLRLGRALALNPRVLLAEHPNASLGADDVPRFAAAFARVVAHRRVATLVLTADPTFASAVAERVLTLNPVTGELKGSTGWRRWVGLGN